MSVLPANCAQNPVTATFFHQRNIEHILARVLEKTGHGEAGSQYIFSIMEKIINYMPGSYSPASFSSVEEFKKAVLQHVKIMNDFVVTEAVREQSANKEFYDYYYRTLTGYRPLIDTSCNQSFNRDTIPVLLPDYTQWSNPEMEK